MNSKRDDDVFEHAGNAIAGFVCGGITCAFGCFVLLCGVISGAERINR
jgi:hypothetical protein